MNLDQLQVQLQPRTSWQAMDLGLKVGRRYYKPLFIISLSLTAFLSVLFYTLTFDTWYAMLLLFWFKPIIERPILYYLSRSIFSDPPSASQIFSNLKGIVFKQWIKTFTYRRLSFSRSFNDPVVLLENLDKEPRSKRLDILHKSDTGSIWLSVLGFNIEILLQIAILIGPYLLLPNGVFEWAFNNSFELENSLLAEIVELFAYGIAVSLVAPFYISCGFMLYLNCRTKLEAWHLELGFKNIVKRLTQTTLCLIFALGSFFMPHNSAWAEVAAVSEVEEKNDNEELNYPKIQNEEANSLKKDLEDILKSDVFGENYQEKEYSIDWDFDFDFDFDSFNSEPNPQDLAWIGALQDIATYLKFFFIICLSLILVYTLYKFRVWQYLSILKPNKSVMPKMVLGMDIQKENLPDNPHVKIEALIRQNELREALSLMFRCHIIHAIQHYSVPFKSSHTEKECQDLIREITPHAEAQAFTTLIELWLNLAYAHRPLKADQVLSVFQVWSPLIKEQP